MSGAWQAALFALWVVVIALLILMLGLMKRVLPVIEHAEHLIQLAHQPGDTFPETSPTINEGEADV